MYIFGNLSQTMCEPEKQRDRNGVSRYIGATATNEAFNHTSMARRGIQVRVGDRVAVAVITENLNHINMPLRRVELEIGDRKSVPSRRRMTNRSVEIQSGQAVKGAYERHITHSQSDYYEQRNEYSQMYHERLNPGFPRSLDHYESCSVDRPADYSMQTPLTPVGDHESAPSARGDPVRLIRRAAVKHNSAKNRKTKTETNDSTIQSTRAPEMASARTPGIQFIGNIPSSRRFSFELISQYNAIESPETPEFEDIPITPTTTETEPYAALFLEHDRQVQASINVSRPQLSAREQQSLPATKEERDEKEDELKDLDRVRRRALTTFDEILGDPRIPTALL
ncbi:hypothetical protein G6011_11591 [Alternaria panax]|uniref:Uncharacterized protein n=1 Tax=Alternaria panax TaxID=48097 RepID=A0AAD4IE13_9PLEO|nr:hypothetical protein G6011_11591 [Alternaria panax]